MDHKRAVHILALEELLKEIIVFQRVDSPMVKVGLEPDKLVWIPVLSMLSGENLANYLHFLSFGSLLPNVDEGNSNISQDNL